MKPYFSISAGGISIMDALGGRGVSLTVTDGVGLKSDAVQIVIDDQDGAVSPPSTGQIISVSGGYIDGPWRDFGTYKVDQVTLRGYPQQINISAQAVDVMTPSKQQEPKHYKKADYPTYKDIFNDVAGKMSLSLSIDSTVGGIKNPYEAQGEEDYISFATRLGEKLDASVTVKAGRLIVVPRGTGSSASGSSLSAIVVSPGLNLLSYSCTIKDKPKYGKVKATWWDRKKVERKEVEEATKGGQGPDFLLRDPYLTEDEAKQAAKSMVTKLARGEGSATFTIDGDPYAQAEAFVMATGIRSLVDGPWRAVTVTHNFSSTAPYTTTIACELPSDGSGSRSGGGGGGGSNTATAPNATGTQTGSGAGLTGWQVPGVPTDQRG